jgi:hypothetical protein
VVQRREERVVVADDGDVVRDSQARVLEPELGEMPDGQLPAGMVVVGDGVDVALSNGSPDDDGGRRPADREDVRGSADAG